MLYLHLLKIHNVLFLSISPTLKGLPGQLKPPKGVVTEQAANDLILLIYYFLITLDHIQVCWTLKTFCSNPSQEYENVASSIFTHTPHTHGYKCM